MRLFNGQGNGVMTTSSTTVLKVFQPFLLPTRNNVLSSCSCSCSCSRRIDILLSSPPLLSFILSHSLSHLSLSLSVSLSLPFFPLVSLVCFGYERDRRGGKKNDAHISLYSLASGTNMDLACGHGDQGKGYKSSHIFTSSVMHPPLPPIAPWQKKKASSPAPDPSHPAPSYTMPNTGMHAP